MRGSFCIQRDHNRSAQPERESQKVCSKTEDGERGRVEESPVGFCAETDVAQKENLKKRKGQGEEDRPDQ